ncbi:hypothetical protein VNI00_007661 [Paramarasmius palmivorus]|uniref:Uncharacterized protein n=1 Tax=Paramarasmius palmivorus TaxID=297713 RepID=A0AAW0D3R9_9AGAR
MDTSLCKIPKDILVDLDTDEDLSLRKRAAYLLYRNGCIIHVEAPSVEAAELLWNMRMVNNQIKREQQLQTIMRLLEGVELQHNQAFCLCYSDKRKDYKLVKNMKKESTKVTVPLWMPKVQIGEFQLIRWVGWNRGVCLWKGRHLDVDIAWASGMLEKLNQQMNGIKLLSRLDLCFAPVAHVLRNDLVIGIASERMSGRAPRYGDRSLIYEAITKLHQHRIYYHGGYFEDMFAIDNGKVRIIDNFFLFRHYEGPTTGTEANWKANAWRTLKNMFSDLLTGQFGPPEEPGALYLVEPVLYKYYQSDAEHPLNNPKFNSAIVLLRYPSSCSLDLEAGFVPRRPDKTVRHPSASRRHDSSRSRPKHSFGITTSHSKKPNSLLYLSSSESTSSSVTLMSSASRSTTGDKWDDSATLVDDEEVIVEVVS